MAIGGRAWLLGEAQAWVRDQLISAEQADAICARYPEPPAGRLAGQVVAVLGAVLLGLGVILFFAWNWDQLHRGFKLALLLGALIAAHAGGQWWLRPDSGRRGLGEATALLGSLLFGAGLWLVSQVYHIDEHMPNAFLAWGLGVWLLAWLQPSSWQGTLAALLLTIWGGLEAIQFDHPQLAAVFLLLSLLPLAIMRCAPWLLGWVASAGLLMLFWQAEPMRNDLGLHVLYAAAVGYIGLAGLLSRQPSGSRQSLSRGFSLPGFAVVLGVLLAMSFASGKNLAISGDWRASATLSGPIWLWCSGLVALTATVLAFAPARWLPGSLNQLDVVWGWQLRLVLTGFVLYFMAAWLGVEALRGVLPGLANVLFIAHALLFIFAGSQQRRVGLVLFGGLLVCGLVFARFTDLFDSLLLRSLAFLLVGAAMVALSLWVTRSRKEAQA